MPDSRATILFLVDLRCLQCGRTAGTLETSQWPWSGPATLRVAPHETVQVADWTRLRCGRCGGNVYSDEVTTTRRYPRVSWDDLDKPRRGRPPGWLVAQRKAAGHANED